MSVEITTGNLNPPSTDFLVPQREARFEKMTQMDGVGEPVPGMPQFTGVPGGPAPGRRATNTPRAESSHALLLRRQSEQRQAVLNAPQAAHELRKRMDDKNTDRYYRSNEVSAIGPQSADGSTMVPGQTRPTPNTFRSGQLRQLDERNTDRYYRDALERGMTRQQIEQHNARQAAAARGQQQGSTTQPVHHSQNVHPLEICNKEDSRPVLVQAAALITQGTPRVIVKIRGPRSLVLPAQTLLDLFVSRQQLTAEQASRIKIDTSQVDTADVVKGGFAGHTADLAFGAPEKLLSTIPQASTADDDAPVDPNDFLNDTALTAEDGTPPDAAGPSEAAGSEDSDADDDTWTPPAQTAQSTQQHQPANPSIQPPHSRKNKRRR